MRDGLLMGGLVMLNWFLLGMNVGRLIFEPSTPTSTTQVALFVIAGVCAIVVTYPIWYLG